MRPGLTQLRAIGTLNLAKPSTATNEPPSFYLEEHMDQGYVILKLNKPPMNTLNSRFLTELTIQLEKLENIKQINGVILTSSLEKSMCAGVDINELYPFDRERCAQFWVSIQELWIRLYGSSKVYIAAINGHAIGAGCLLPMSCDYRLMARGPFKIGANETLLVRHQAHYYYHSWKVSIVFIIWKGLQAAFWLRDVMLKIIGNRETEKAIQLGLLFTPEEALRLRLVDELCAPQDLLPKAQEHMKMWLKIPSK